MAALFGFHEGANDVVALPGAVALGRVADLVGEIAEQAGVLLLPQQDAIGGIAIAAGAAGLLIILLDRFGQGEVNHGADGGFVDAEAEGDGSD